MKRIVIYRLGSIGDTVVALPCFKIIRSSYPDHEILVLTNVPISHNAAPLLSVLGNDQQLVDGVIAYPVGTRSMKVLWKLAMQLRALKADALIYLMADRSAMSAWRDWGFFKLAGFVQIIGFPYKKELRKNLIDEQTQTLEREALRLLRCIEKVGQVDINEASSWDLDLTLSEREAGHEFVKLFDNDKYFSVNMGGKEPIKDWGLTNWQALFSSLKDKYGTYGLLAIGASSDFESAQKLLDGWSGKTVNACGKLSPRVSAAALEKSILFIGHDSGPFHLASALGVRAIGLYGDYNQPNLWHPYSHLSKVIHNMQGISAISVKEVESKIDCILKTLI